MSFKRKTVPMLAVFATAALLFAATGCGGDDGGGEGGGGEGGSGGGGVDCAADPCNAACTNVDCRVCEGQHPDCPAPECAADPTKSCGEASDCGNVADFACVSNCCIELCATNADCASRAECTAAALGCVCDEGFCKTKVCSADNECGGGSVCVDGGCVTAPAASEASTCAIEPRFGVVHEGDTLQLFAKAYDASGKPLNLGGFTWTSNTQASATVDATGLVTGAGTTGTATITATVGGATCTSELQNFAAAAANELRVVAVDELTGLPLEGATVQVEVQGGQALSGTTGADGSATFTGTPNGGNTVTVFHADYAYVTVVGTTRTDLLIQLRRNILPDKIGGFAGKFVPASLFDDNNVHAGVAGTSIPGNLVDLSFEVLIGPSIDTTINLGGERVIPLPSGIAIGLGSQWFKEGFAALGVPGACSDRAKTAAGTCGTRTGWGVAGGVPLSQLPIDQLAGGGDLNIGQLLATLLPQFQKFKSGVKRDIEFDMIDEARILGADGKIDPAKLQSELTQSDLEVTHELALRGTVNVPTLPQIGGQYTAAVIVLGGSNAPGRGVVPLGLTAGIDANTSDGETPDGKVNDLEGESNGKLLLRMAPLHSGLEGTKYGVIALALNLSGLGGGESVCTVADRSGCTALSGLVKLFDSFPYDTTVDFGTPFVGFAENATFDAATRGFALGGAVANANVYRVNMKATDGREWNVFFSSANGFTLPTPPAGFEDRTTDGAGRAALSVQAMKVNVDLDGLVDFDSTNFSNLVEVTTAFSTTDIPE